LNLLKKKNLRLQLKLKNQKKKSPSVCLEKLSKVPMISMQALKDENEFLTNDFLIFEFYLIIS
jgi:hypothetical protein